MVKIKKEIIGCIVDNINDQNGVDSLMGLSLFDLSSDEDFESRLDQLSKFYDMYGVDNEHLVKKQWYNYDVRITYKRRLSCSKAEISEQFQKAWPKINMLSTQFHEAKDSDKPITQYELWRKFVLSN